MSIFSSDEEVQSRAIDHVYRAISQLLKQGIIVAKYREAIIIDSLVHNRYELEDIDTYEMMISDINETVVLNYELDRPIDLSKLSLIKKLEEPFLLDSSYLLFKQQVEITIEKLLRELLSTFKLSVTASIEDYTDNGDILWDIKISLMQGRRNV